MRRLSAVTLAWRNFLYANPEGYCHNPEELWSRISLIQNEREAILAQMLKDEPDMNEIQMSKEEIAFQIENLEDMADEFERYLQFKYSNGLEVSQTEILEDFKQGTESELYIVAKDWQEHADSAYKIVQEFWEKFDYICNAEAEEYLLQQMMDLQMSPKERENLQTVKKQLNERSQSLEKYFINKVKKIQNEANQSNKPVESQSEQQIKQEATPTTESNTELAEQMSEEELMLLEAQTDQGMVMER